LPVETAWDRPLAKSLEFKERRLNLFEYLQTKALFIAVSAAFYALAYRLKMFSSAVWPLVGFGILMAYLIIQYLIAKPKIKAWQL
jgi:hypothetical protein